MRSESISDDLNQSSKAVIIGASGRCGTGAKDFLCELGWQIDGWDRRETQAGGPFKALLNYNLLVNCVLAVEKCPPFINRELLNKHRGEVSLKTISDVSCDPDSEYNMIPLYAQATKLEQPVINVEGGIQLTAIDNLPSILPKESSYDFSSQLTPFFIDFNSDNGPISVSLDYYLQTINDL